MNVTSDNATLGHLFRPRGVAVVGVSGRPESLTARPIRLLRENYSGAVYPVNPRYEELYGLRCYSSLDDIEGHVDLVLSLVPAKDADEVIRGAGRIGAKVVIVFASGFSEIGESGQQLQAQLLETARSYGVRVLGPNCLGFINRSNGLFATFSPAGEGELPPPSGVAYVGQSGAIGGSLLDMSRDIGLGLSVWAATGNQVDIDLVEMANAIVDEGVVRVLLMYAEGIADGCAFMQLVQMAERRGVRLVLLRSGRSAEGKRAAASHTGAMLSDDTGLVAAAQANSVVLVDDLSELLTVGAVLALPTRPRGHRMAVVTTSGGAGILMADQCERHGLKVAQLSAETIRRVEEIIPRYGSARNPVDVTAQILDSPSAMDDMRRLCDVLSQDNNVDGIILVLTMVTGGQAGDLARLLVEASNDLSVPLWVTWLTGQESTREARDVLRRAGVPIFSSPAQVARTLSLAVSKTTSESGARNTENRIGEERPDARVRIAVDRWQNNEDSTWSVLDALGIRRPTFRIVKSAVEALNVAPHLGNPVVMKVDSEKVKHKTELGGVRVDVSTEDAGDVFEELMGHLLNAGVNDGRVLIQEQVPSGVELIIGATSSRSGFPATITVGIGGVATEIYRDIVTRSAPVDYDQANEMLRALQGWPLLDGYRGTDRVDVQSAVEAVVRVSEFISVVEVEGLEFEINPLVVGAPPDGAVAVDILIGQ